MAAIPASLGDVATLAPGAAITGEVVFKVDDLHFALRRSNKRRTLQITVERNGALILSAPPSVGYPALREFVLEKRIWIYTKLAEKDRLQRVVPHKEYVDGEGFLYLGRSYRLKLADTQSVPLKLVGGRFVLRRDAVLYAREHFIRWYSERARAWLVPRLPEWASRLQVVPAGIKVQDLGYRWGSCGKGSWLYFHWKTILLPARVAEYVLVHELAHLKEPYHVPEFWLRVERAMPDYEQRKAWLAEHGMDVEGI